jgi:hypothetical protein
VASAGLCDALAEGANGETPEANRRELHTDYELMIEVRNEWTGCRVRTPEQSKRATRTALLHPPARMGRGSHLSLKGGLLKSRPRVILGDVDGFDKLLSRLGPALSPGSPALALLTREIKWLDPAECYYLTPYRIFGAKMPCPKSTFGLAKRVHAAAHVVLVAYQYKSVSKAKLL